MANTEEFKRFGSYRNIIGSARDTINAIQKYIDEHNSSKQVHNVEVEESADSINRIIECTACEETRAEIQKIINRL